MSLQPIRIILLLLIAPAALHPSPLLEFSFSPDVNVASRIIESLAAGHRAEVHYEARVYQHGEGLARIFGDKLIEDVSVVYISRWDGLNERYIVTTNDERERTFDTPEELTAFLLSLVDYRIVLPERANDNTYLLCRALIQPIRLVPPLTLMTFLVPGFRITTPWMATPFTEVDR